MNRPFILILALLTAPSLLAATEPPALLDRAGIRGGLAVHLGTVDGRIECELAAGGRFLVHGLALDEAARDLARERIEAARLAGLASVSGWVDRRRLPYASSLATAVIADLDALGNRAPPEAEMLRIASPGGIFITRKSGDWTAARRPRPDGLDDWTHFDHGADGNPVSTDAFVEPVRQQLWISGVQPNPFEGNPAGYDPGGGVRLWDRYAVLDVQDAYTVDPKDRNGAWVLQGRDAFNGVPLWSIPRDRWTGGRRWSFAADDGEVYAWLKRDGELTALRIDTGEILRTYPGTQPGKDGLREETVCIRLADQYLVVGLRDRIACFDRSSARERWRFSREGKILLGTVVDEPERRVYGLAAQPGDRREFGGRWPVNPHAEALLAFDLDTGQIRWEQTGIASRDLQPAGANKLLRRAPGQVLPAGRFVVVFGSAAISGGDVPYIASLDASDGRLLHQNDEPFRREYNVAAYNALYRDGAVWFAGAFSNVWRFDPETGEVLRVFNNGWNQRCTRFTATGRYFIFGQTAYYRPDFSGEQVCVARSGCAMGGIPANGLTYFTPTACGCITQVRGFQAMTGEGMPEPLPENLRILPFDVGSSKLDVGSSVTVTEHPTSNIEHRTSNENPKGLIAADWPKQWRAGNRETATVQAGELTLKALVHQHRIEARHGDRLVWRFTADARISSSPVIHGDLALFGAHDGYVYAVRLDDGALRWKYLLAPAERYICVNGQLESAWPVYGVAIREGELIASAGTHVELDGGVTVAALNPATGEPVWKKRLQKSPSPIPPGGKNARIVAFSFINSVPRIEGEKIVLGDGGRIGGRFEFHPGESDEDLNRRLNEWKKK